ncbi:hypothetical protein LTS08_000407 [Lithohypha guttulata]|nr:hypothetical protein LTS08_000407 [Lithohypha guttulata]
MSEALNNDNNDTATQAPPRLDTASPETENTVITASPQSFSEPAVYGHSYQTHTISGGHNILGNVYFGAASDPEADLFSRASAVKRQATGPSLLPKASISFFTGRRLQLEQLKTWLLEPISNVLSRKVVVVHGLGGSGKTQFCLRYAEQNRSSPYLTSKRYWGVFWIDASTLKAADRSYEQIGDIFRKGATPAGGRFWLSQQHQPWLMIVDNADDPDLDMPSVLPIGTRGHILITSRNPNVKDHATAGTIHLTKMEPEEAIDLLLRTAYPDDASARARNTYRNCAMGIAEQLGYLAIALRHAGSTIRRKIYTIEKYLSLYLARRGYLINPRMSLNDKEADIITTWEIPFQRLENRASSRCGSTSTPFRFSASSSHTSNVAASAMVLQGL